MIKEKSKSIITVSMLLTVMFVGLIGLSDVIVNPAESIPIIVDSSGAGNYITIQAAIDNATTGDTIYVWNGTYNENIVVNKTVTIIGNGTESCKINGSKVGNVVLVTADWVNISGFQISNSSSNWGYAGMRLEFVENCTIENNNVSTSNRAGITVWYADDNTIHNNAASFNSGNSYFGIHIWNSNNNVITNNTINSNYWGLALNYSTDNMIFNNNVFQNTYGINLENSSNNNRVYRNNIINNTVQAFDDGVNLWNDTYPICGNYWDDYSGVDSKTGPNQDQPGIDSIGDTDYTNIGGGVGALDEYPLMHQFVWWAEIAPWIQLLSPANNSQIIAGTDITFNIWDDNYDLESVSYSINSGTAQSFGINFTIDTTTASEGALTINVYAMDSMGNYLNNQYNYFIDSANPTIDLISPANNSVIAAGTIIDLEVTDANLDEVNYTINGGPNISIDTPYNIFTTGWTDGNYIIEVTAFDLVGNKTVEWYNFTIDSTSPAIDLISPLNNSVIIPGTIIDINVMDIHLDSVIYLLDGGSSIPLSLPYNISTNGLTDGIHSFFVNATDIVGNYAVENYSFIFDSKSPEIILVSPPNRSIIRAGINVSFNIIEPNLVHVHYSVNSTANNTLLAPYNITTTGVNDGEYVIEVHALDLAGYSATESFNFTIDSTKPAIKLISPSNNSEFLAGIAIDLDINDTNLVSVNYSLDGGSNTTFTTPYDIDTTSWPLGDHTILVAALDAADNVNIRTFVFKIREPVMIPKIESTDPVSNSTEVLIDTKVIITFSIPIDTSTVPGVLSILPSVGFNLNWSADNKVLTMEFIGNLSFNTSYTITIGAVESPSGGMLKDAPYEFNFTTELEPIIVPKTLSIIYPLNDTEFDTKELVLVTGTSTGISEDTQIIVRLGSTPVSGTIRPDGSWSVTLQTPSADGRYSIDASVGGVTASIIIRVKGIKESITITDPLTSTRVEPGDVLEISGTSSGLAEGTEVIVTMGDILESGTIGNNGIWEIELIAPETQRPYTLTVSAGGVTDALSVIVEKEKPEEPKEDDDKGMFGLGQAMDFMIILVIIIIIIVIIIIMLLRKKKSEEGEEAAELEEEAEVIDDEDSMIGAEEAEVTEQPEMFNCPDCGAEVAAGTAACPDCGAVFQIEEYECPDCGAKIDEADTVCHECGAEFEEDEEEDEVEEVVKQPTDTEVGETTRTEPVIEKFECPTCGATVPDDSAECPECGEEFEED
jgi:parallel beta-helix repeat protein